MATGFIVEIGYGAPSKSFWTGLKQVKAQQHEIATWRCGRCGFLESYAM